MYSRARAFASRPYGRILRTLYSRRGLPWNVHDEIIRIDPGVRHLVPHEPEPALFNFLRSAIRPGDVVLDVGGFLGVYAVLAARWSGPGGRVVTFEPAASSAALLQRHLTFNRVTGVDLIEAAVSDSAGPAAFHDYGSTSTPYVSSLASAVDTDATPVVRHVDVVTIDDICRNLGVVPTVVRMDVQGAEIHALRGARETIRAAPRLSLVVEMHPQCWPSFGLTEAMVRDALHELGLSARPLVPGEPLFARDTHAVLSRTGEMGS